eukprot:483073-Rhodomonas_salina.1
MACPRILMPVCRRPLRLNRPVHLRRREGLVELPPRVALRGGGRPCRSLPELPAAPPSSLIGANAAPIGGAPAG